MSIATVANFADALRRYHLLEPAQLDELTRDLQARFPEPKALAREMLQRGWLTPFQINQLFLDKGADLLLGSYVVLERLGEGGMGTVFKARNWKLGQTVALKVIHKNRLAHGGAVERFQREIRAAAKLNHPHIVRAFDADVAGDRHFFVMEHIEGADLGKLLKEQGPLPIAEACEYMRQAALGLQHACDRGLVHRDIKPNNLLVARTRKDSGTSAQAPVLKILDMGLARLDQGGDNDEDATSTLTQEGAVMGTVDYMAPEQALDSHRVDIRADLYSLGCTFYYLLAGRVPFPGGEALQKLLRHREQEATPIEQLRPDVPERLSAIIRQLMAKRPEDRWQSPAELAAALETCLRETPKEQAAAPPRVAGPGVPREPFAHLLSQDTAIGATSFPRVESKRPWLLVVVAGVGVLLGMAGLVLLLYLLREKPKPVEPPKPVEVVPPNPRPPALANEPLPPRLTIQAQQNVISHLAFAPDGRLLISGSKDRSARAWDPVSGTARWATLNKLHEVSALAYSADGRRLAAGQVWTQSAVLLDPETGKPLTGVTHPARTGPIALAANGKTLAVGGGDDGTILVVDIDSGDKRFLKHDKQVTGLAFAPAGPWLASLGYYDMKLWHLGENVPLSSTGSESLRGPVAFTADGNQVVLIKQTSPESQRGLVFLNVPSLTEGRVVPLINSEGHAPWAYAPDLRTVAAARPDGMITLWDAATGEKRATLKGPATTVRAICFSWDSKTLATGGEDGCICIWDVPSPSAGASGK